MQQNSIGLLISMEAFKLEHEHGIEKYNELA